MDEEMNMAEGEESSEAAAELGDGLSITDALGAALAHAEMDDAVLDAIYETGTVTLSVSEDGSIAVAAGSVTHDVPAEAVLDAAEELIEAMDNAGEAAEQAIEEGAA
jgi:hypothetical protein